MLEVRDVPLRSKPIQEFWADSSFRCRLWSGLVVIEIEDSWNVIDRALPDWTVVRDR